MSDLLDPNDYIISRKRKKYKFAKFHNADNCFEFDEWQKSPADIVEIGAGTGLFAVELASRHPEKMVVAVDVKADRLQKGAYEALSRGIANIAFIRARADQLPELFPERSVEMLWLTFSDPFPRQRSAGRRMTHPTYLTKYAGILAEVGSLAVKHDDLSFFQWSLEQLVAKQWRITELSFDLHDSAHSDDYKILTSYERRWIGEGKHTQFVRARPPVD